MSSNGDTSDSDFESGAASERSTKANTALHNWEHVRAGTKVLGTLQGIQILHGVDRHDFT